jgi:CheY-like chemotaxis protein
MKIYLFCNDETKAARDIINAFKPELISTSLLDENYQGNQEELSADIVHAKNSELNNSDLIVIQLEEELENLSFYIGHRIRLDPHLRTKPLVFFGKKDLLKLISESPFLPMILISKGTRYYQNSLVLTHLKGDLSIVTKEATGLSDAEVFRDSILRKLRLPEPDKQGRHSIANQWGARQLAMVGGIEIKDHLISKALYFQLLTAGLQENKIRERIKEAHKLREDLNVNAGHNGPVNQIPALKRVLLIDDNHDKGWNLVLTGLFWKEGQDEHHRIDSFQGFTDHCEESLKTQDYDFVLLDFYFGEKDTKGIGLEVLKKIKKLNPVLPVIMFTASNKAWNMDDLYEAGADGYYIKEHPDTASDADFSINNFNNFIKTLDRCRKKGKLLKPYWQALKEIGALFSAKQGPVKEKTLSDGSRSDFRGRISERITMFIGLLKKAYEQTTFDEKAFLYSEYELAFLTLWSVLNEFEEAYFKKIQGMEQEHGIPDSFRLFHNDENQTPLVSHWYFKETVKYLEYVNPNSGGRLVQDFNGFFDLKPFSSFYHRDWEVKNGDTRAIKWNMQISKHILFLIQKIKPSAPRPLLAKLSLNIIELNKLRNKLYLTHGGHANSPDYSDVCENTRESKEFWKTTIEDLFFIVYFLCTAKEWNQSN